MFSVTNAFYTLTRSRKYRLFEADIEVKPSTPSARRVRVQSAPASPSVLRFIADAITPESAESRAHSDKTRDVWELSVWDPLPISLQLFCLFGPGHVLVYTMFLPLAPLDSQPSVTVLYTLALQVLMSGLLLLLCSRFDQQAKDQAIIKREVMHEYDAKFVHPRLHPVVRDVGTQVSDLQPRGSRAFVQVGTPTTLIRRAFQTRANPNYNNQVDSGNDSPEPSAHTNVMRPNMFTPPTAPRRSESGTPAMSRRSSAVRQSLPAGYTPSAAPASVSASTLAGNASPSKVGATPSKNGSTNFGGYMGVYTHQNSPLKKTTSLNDISSPMPQNSREMAAYEQQRALGRAPSPVKNGVRRSTGMVTDENPNQFAAAANNREQFAAAARNRAQQRERYPSRW